MDRVERVSERRDWKASFFLAAGAAVWAASMEDLALSSLSLSHASFGGRSRAAAATLEGAHAPSRR